MAAAHELRIGIDLGGTKIEGVALAQGGIERVRRRVPTPAHDYRATVAAIVALVAAIESEIGATATVGVGMPGTLSPATGLVKNANATWLIGRPFDADLAAALGRPVRVANDANCFALSEATDGAARGRRGRLRRDPRHRRRRRDRRRRPRRSSGPTPSPASGDTIPLPWPEDDERPGPPATAAGAAASRPSCRARARRRLSPRTAARDLAPADIAARADDGDDAAAASLDRYGDRLARALASVINILDPDVIVLGGGLSNIDRLYRDVPRLWGAWSSRIGW